MISPTARDLHARRVRVVGKRLVGASVALLALLAVTMPSPAAGARDLEVSIMDDQLLLNSPQEKVDEYMAVFNRLGIDRLRLSAFWSQVAPAPMSRQKPAGFNARDPLDPAYDFATLDRVVSSASAHGLRLMISLSTPAPIWATGRRRKPNPLWKPSPAEFADFSEAVVRRYGPLVDHWGIANEPNQGVWLQPQSDRRGLVAPHIYRALVQASYPRIKAFDPDSTALVGELASTGRKGRGPTVNIRPLAFLRAMACRDRRNRPIRRGRCRGFRPVPLDALGHHPYQLLLAPTRHSIERDDAAIADGPRLSRVLDRLIRAGALRGGRGRRLAIFYTEFGYQTNPPDPFAGVSLGAQRRYLQQAAYVAWRTPRARGINQFRLTDGLIGGGGVQRFREFQSGLLFRSQRPKPAYSVFAQPFVVLGNRFWGQVRPGEIHTVRVEHRRSRRGRFRMVAQIVTDRLGYFSFRLVGRRPGEYRYTYTDPPGTSGIVRVRR
jgi:hypothetical protein